MFFNGLMPTADSCSGCSACEQICPKDAISWTHNDEGFIYPIVDYDKCIECGLCEKVCPIIHSENTLCYEPSLVYAAINNDKKQLKNSSSGGVFSIIADYVLDKGGVVCGASYDKDFKLIHDIIADKQHLWKLRGSKYIQSQNESIYSSIKEILKSGRIVYYVGTGCQVSGLKLFLRKEYDNLITSDIFCHGIPPQSVFDEVIKFLREKTSGEVLSYNFRDKSIWGWSCSSSSSIRIGKRINYLGNEPIQNGYFNAFIKAVNYREVCYHCPFAQTHRTGDISLADFWGVEKYINIPDIRNGVSAIMVNTAKGRQLLEKLKHKVALYEATIDEVAVINRTLVEPTPRPAERDVFFSKFRENPSGLLISYATTSRKRTIVYHLKRNPLTSCLIREIKKFLRK